jgi:hypothetical protein
MTEVSDQSTSLPNAGAADGAPAADADPAPASSKVREAIGLLKQHPLGAVATVAAAAAFIEVEFAVGLLAGLGATALLAGQSGPEARQQVLARGKWALDRARIAMRPKAKAAPAEASSPA